MGGQACVFYGAAQVSKDVDFLILAGEENFSRLFKALEKLQAKRIAVPKFDPKILARGHAVHFRCQAPGVQGLRIDLMTKLRDLPDFELLWERCTVVGDDSGTEFHLLSVPDLVQAKKTQRSKDWPMIEALVSIHFQENCDAPTAEWIAFWLNDARSPELLIDLATRFPAEARKLETSRPLLSLAISGNMSALREALDAEVRAEQEIDRKYWEPLKREMEAFRRAEREGGQTE
ncbi:MAG: hypothetical protein WCQ57_11990 [Verrucomicrobiota bacterium]